MAESQWDILRDQGRGVAGALLVAGLSLLYTMESWWLAWRLPIRYLFLYAFVGLIAVLFAARAVGFRTGAERRTWSNIRTLTDFSELLLQSFVTAYLVLLLIGVIEPGESLTTVVRLGLIFVVPLGLGAALANALLQQRDEALDEGKFPENVAVFALGALFVTFPVAPTQEMEMIAGYMGWERAPLVIVASILTSYLVLYELGFRGQRSRVQSYSRRFQVGTTFIVYAVAVAISTVLLFTFGHFADTTVSEMVMQVVVLSVPGSVGASAGEVVL